MTRLHKIGVLVVTFFILASGFIFSGSAINCCTYSASYSIEEFVDSALFTVREFALLRPGQFYGIHNEQVFDPAKYWTELDALVGGVEIDLYYPFALPSYRSESDASTAVSAQKLIIDDEYPSECNWSHTAPVLHCGLSLKDTTDNRGGFASISSAGNQIAGFLLLPSVGGWSFIEPLRPLLERLGYSASELDSFEIDDGIHILYDSTGTSFEFEMPFVGKPGNNSSYTTSDEGPLSLRINETLSVHLNADHEFESLSELSWVDTAQIWFNEVDVILNRIQPHHMGGFRLKPELRGFESVDSNSVGAMSYVQVSPSGTTLTDVDFVSQPNSIVVRGSAGDRPLVIPGSAVVERLSSTGEGSSTAVPIYLDIPSAAVNSPIDTFDITVYLIPAPFAKPVGKIINAFFGRPGCSGTVDLTGLGTYVKIRGDRHCISWDSHSGFKLADIEIIGLIEGSNAIDVYVHKMFDTAGGDLVTCDPSPNPLCLDVTQNIQLKRPLNPALGYGELPPIGTLMVVKQGVLNPPSGIPRLKIGDSSGRSINLFTGGPSVEVPIYLTPAASESLVYLIRFSMLWPEIAVLEMISTELDNPLLDLRLGEVFEGVSVGGLSPDRSYGAFGGWDVNASHAGQELQELGIVTLRGVQRGSSLAMLEADYVNALDLICDFATDHDHEIATDIHHLLTGRDLVKMSHIEMGDAFSEFPARNVDLMGVADGIGGMNIHTSKCNALIEHNIGGSGTDPTEMLFNPSHHSITQHAPSLNVLGGSYQGLLLQDVLLIMHEIGHNLGAYHDSDPSNPENAPIVCFQGTVFPFRRCGKPIMSPILDPSVIPLFSYESTIAITDLLLCRKRGICSSP